MREQIAALCHEQWSEWMECVFDMSTKMVGGGMLIPRWAVDRWTRQMETLYEDLSEEEKNSDRKEADKFIEIFK